LRKKLGSNLQKDLSAEEQVLAKQTTHKQEIQHSLKYLPHVGKLLEHALVKDFLSRCPRKIMIHALRKGVAKLRTQLSEGQLVLQSYSQATDLILGELEQLVKKERRGKLRRVINATGVVIHTNLGRSPLSGRALDRLKDLATGYCNLEYNIEERQRGGRMDGIRDCLCQLTDCQDALVVNNNAAAVMLVLAALASGREVVISRGELIEIGGSFRIPDVMAASGVILREVGTTNCTHLRDYQAAIGPQTAMLLKVHRSNYAVRGFTAEVELSELVNLARCHNIPVMCDLGSGMLLDLKSAGLDIRSSDEEPVYEPSVKEIVKTGADIITWSGDKMLGGPQAGIILGNYSLITQIASHPLARAVRSDKLLLGTLEATLQCYMEGADIALNEIPIWQQMACSMEVLWQRGNQIMAALEVRTALQLSLGEGRATVGGGALPATFIPSVRLAVTHSHHSAQRIDQFLRERDIPIIGLLEHNSFVLDLRTIFPYELDEITQALSDLSTS
jgi:L-seryl-tRNA(Ser) seleniumtransferase